VIRPPLATRSAPSYRLRRGQALAVVCTLAIAALTSHDAAPRRTAIASHSDGRLVEGRFDVGDPYRPYLATSQAGATQSASSEARRRLTALGASSDPEARELALAAVHLAQADIPAAIEQLEAAVAVAPSARLLLALSATYLELGRAEPRRRSISAARALDAAEHAAALSPSADAAFNRALALERLALPDAADGWRAYLRLDLRSPWAREAAIRLKSLESAGRSDWPDAAALLLADSPLDEARLHALAERFSDRCRELVEDVLVPRWAEAVLSGESAAAEQLLNAAYRVARALVAARGDRSTLDALDDVARPGAVGNVSQLAAASLDAAAARAAIDRGEVEGATARLDRARRLLRRANDDVRLLDFYALLVGYYRSDYGRIEAELARLAVQAESRDRVYVASRCRFILAGIAYRRGRFADAERTYSDAASLFARAGETAYLAATHAIVARLRLEQGDEDGAWGALQEALVLLPDVPGERHRYSILRAGELMARDLGLPRVALSFNRAVLQTAATWSNPVVRISGLAGRAVLLASMQQAQAARPLVERARAALPEIPDASVRALSATEVADAEGRLAMAERPCDAIAAYDQAIATARASASYQLARLLLARGRAHRACGAARLAERDFRSGIDVFETQRQNQTDVALRISHFDEAWELYGELIGLLARDPRTLDEALRVSEQTRARTLTETLSAARERFAREALDAGTLVLDFVVLHGEVLVWAFTRDTSRFMRLAIDRDALGRLVDAWRRRVDAGVDERPQAEALFRVLLGPVQDLLQDGQLVVVIADGPLHGLAFGALWDGRRYLVEQSAFWSAPSLKLLAWSERRARAPRELRSALSVGDPAFARTRFPTLARLPAAAREALAIARVYPQASALIGSRADRHAILSQLPRADVVHLATHAVAGAWGVNDSYVVAAATDEGPDVIGAAEIAALRVSTRLVALAACRTAGGRVARGEGPLSLARAFMSAGVPTIVATLWDAGDGNSYDLFVYFHKALRGGASPAAALRGAQLALLRDADPERRRPRAWAIAAGFGAAGLRHPIQARMVETS
jgi:CHAT domain-containing protein